MQPTALVLEHLDPTGQEIVARLPEDGDVEVTLGSQLVVQESQEAVFFRDGRALDTFGPSRHTLTTQNLPLLNRLMKATFGTTPFRVAVVFVGKKTFIDQKWGTRDAIAFRDTELSMVRLRAFGRYSLRIDDSQLFVNTLVGTQGRYTTDFVEGYFRDVIVARLTDLLGESYKSIFDLPRSYDEISVALRARLEDDTRKYGVTIPDLYVGAITPPEEVQQKIDERAAMGAVGDMGRYMQYKTAEALGDAAQGGGGAGGAMGAGLGLGMGAGLGAGVGAMLPGVVQQTLGSGAGQSAPAVPANAVSCVCGAAVPSGAAFCSACGVAVPAAASCTECGKPVAADDRFCAHCGAGLTANCSKCQQPMLAGVAFCSACGTKRDQ